LRSSKLKFKQPLRVLHLGDIHVERLTGRETQVLRLVNDLAPDLILFSGDILNLSYTHDPLAHAHARKVLEQLAAPLGVFMVSGSPGVDSPDVMNDVLRGVDNVHWLRDEAVALRHDGEAFELKAGLPGALGYVTFAAELIGGVLLVAGIRTRLVALVLTPFVAGAAWAHAGNGWVFTAQNGGWEYPAFLTLATLVTALLGNGERDDIEQSVLRAVQPSARGI
jgi:uncharacterized membrane protein YphA (DoxX/SURF4 family)